MTKEHSKEPKLPFRKTLVFKLIWIFVAVSLVGSSIHLWTFLSFYRLFFDRVLQVANWEIAEKYASQLRSYTSPVFQEDKVEEIAFSLSELNPTFDLYLLNKKGEIVFSTYYRVSGKVDLETVRSFVKADGFPLTPFYGRTFSASPEDDIPGPFSAAEISLSGEPGYVYVVLRGVLHREVYQALGDFTLMALAIIAILAISLLVTLLGVFLSLLFSGRFKRLTHAVVAFSAGKYETRIGDTKDDELGYHAQAFDQMAQRIEDNIVQLEESDALRRELIANVSHDLRTPIGAMQILLETLRSKLAKSGKEEELSFVERAVVNCLDLRTLINDLFELSKLDARKAERLEIEPLDLCKLLRAILKKFVTQAEEKDMAICLDCPQDLPEVLGDQKLLVRAVSNLVENAIRYSAHGGEVRIAAEKTASSLVGVSVSDTGLGIAEEDLPRLFDRYYRGSRASQKDESGTGLGLAITKRIIELHGQEIAVESTPGAGSTFSFTLCQATD